jgi:hypothetical protein
MSKWVMWAHFKHLRSNNFQLYKELLNPMGFDPFNRSLKIQESIGNPTPKVGVHFGVWRFNSHTLPYFQPLENMKCDSQASLLARTFANLCFGHEKWSSHIFGLGSFTYLKKYYAPCYPFKTNILSMNKSFNHLKKNSIGFNQIHIIHSQICLIPNS